MTQSNENKWMFEAKRLDNGEVIEFVLGDCTKLISDWYAVGFDEGERKIDPSTIKPLFKAEPKREEWIFENVDKVAYRNLTNVSRELIHDQIMEDVSKVEYFEQEDLEWMDIHDNYESVFFGAIYRVKAPQYTLDDALKAMDTRPGVRDSVSRDILIKFAKANGLGGNNE